MNKREHNYIFTDNQGKDKKKNANIETVYDSNVIRSNEFADKIIESEGNVEIRGIKYYQRIFTDGCAELVRYNSNTKMWAVLCFPNEDKPGAIDKIREAIRNNFDISVGTKKQ